VTGGWLSLADARSACRSPGAHAAEDSGGIDGGVAAATAGGVGAVVAPGEGRAPLWLGGGVLKTGA